MAQNNSSSNVVIAFASRTFLPSTQFQLSTLKLLCVCVYFIYNCNFLSWNWFTAHLQRQATDTCTSTTMMLFWFNARSWVQSSHKMDAQITQIPNTIDCIIKWMIQLWMGNAIFTKRFGPTNLYIRTQKAREHFLAVVLWVDTFNTPKSLRQMLEYQMIFILRSWAIMADVWWFKGKKSHTHIRNANNENQVLVDEMWKRSDKWAGEGVRAPI